MGLLRPGTGFIAVCCCCCGGGTGSCTTTFFDQYPDGPLTDNIPWVVHGSDGWVVTNGVASAPYSTAGAVYEDPGCCTELPITAVWSHNSGSYLLGAAASDGGTGIAQIGVHHAAAADPDPERWVISYEGSIPLATLFSAPSTISVTWNADATLVIVVDGDEVFNGNPNPGVITAFSLANLVYLDAITGAGLVVEDAAIESLVVECIGTLPGGIICPIITEDGIYIIEEDDEFVIMEVCVEPPEACPLSTEVLDPLTTQTGDILVLEDCPIVEVGCPILTEDDIDLLTETGEQLLPEACPP